MKNFSTFRNVHRESKNMALDSCPRLSQILTDFQHSLTDRLSRQFTRQNGHFRLAVYSFAGVRRLRRCWRWWFACSRCCGCRTAPTSSTTRSPPARTTTSGSCSSAGWWSTQTAPSIRSSTTPCPSSSAAPSAVCCSAAGPRMSAATGRTVRAGVARWVAAAGRSVSTAPPGRWPPTTRCTRECLREPPDSASALIPEICSRQRTYRRRTFCMDSYRSVAWELRPLSAFWAGEGYTQLI